MLDHYLQAVATVLLPHNLLAMVLGSLWGLLAGALPGISTSMGVVLLLSFTYSLSPMTAFVLLVGAYLGGITGGSITSILFGIPGEPSSVPTVIEGHALAKKGRATFALWVYLLCSIYGGLFSVVVMIVATPLIASFALKFGPAEYFALTVLGLSVVSGLSGGSMLKGFLSCFFGLFLATIGTDGITGEERYTFDTTILLGGINFVVAMVGLLAVSEIFIEAEEPFKEYKGGVQYRGMLREFPPFSLFKGYLLTMIRSPIIGTIVGALPGAGATIAAFLSYGEAARTAKREPEKFGKGAVEGLMAAECANNASTGGSMTILLSLGIPGSNTTAMMIAAFMIHGMQPGPLLLSTRPDIVYGIFASMLLTNLLLLGLTILAIRMFLELNRMPYSIFSAAIMILCAIGAYGLTNNMDDVYLMFAFSLIGYAMRKFDIPVAPCILALVLGDMAELSLRRALLLSGGSPLILVGSPISIVLLSGALLSIVYPLFKKPKMLQGL
ncbi:MAG: tripartite tricarboxylate transporter permease [Deltaproteobacteria bacterium]|nr:tripartite tricarboxylate transporter permease [Deltaproteobacteria bacterium]